MFTEICFTISIVCFLTAIAIATIRNAEWNDIREQYGYSRFIGTIDDLTCIGEIYEGDRI